MGRAVREMTMEQSWMAEEVVVSQSEAEAASSWGLGWDCITIHGCEFFNG